MKLLNTNTQELTMIAIIQDWCCAICRQPFKTTPYIDHDHETLAIRGLLCSRCNTGLGMFKDSIRRLAGAIVYLELAKKRLELDLPYETLNEKIGLKYLDEEGQPT